MDSMSISMGTSQTTATGELSEVSPVASSATHFHTCPSPILYEAHTHRHNLQMRKLRLTEVKCHTQGKLGSKAHSISTTPPPSTWYPMPSSWATGAGAGSPTSPGSVCGLALSSLGSPLKLPSLPSHPLQPDSWWRRWPSETTRGGEVCSSHALDVPAHTANVYFF